MSINSSSPVVWIIRNLALDQAAVALSAKNGSQKIQSCLMCGEVSPLASLTQGRTHYLRQVELFKTYLPDNDDDCVETCANCLQSVKAVWDLTQQIEAIKEDIASIVGKVAVLGKRDVSKEDQGEGQSIRGMGSDEIEDDLDIGESDQLSEETIDVEVKEEIYLDEDEDIAQDELVFEEITTVEVKQQLGEEDVSVPEFNPGYDLRQIKRKRKPARDPLAFGDSGEEAVVSDESQVRQRPSSTCHLCGKVLSTRGSLTSHIRFVHRGYRRPKHEKSKTLSTKCRVNRQPEKPKTCPHCNKKFSRKNFNRHINLVHLGQRPYKCSQCEKTYKTRHSLDDHVNWIHSQEFVPCSLCGKEFATRRTWATHEALSCEAPGWGPERLKKEFNVTLITCPVQGCGKQLDSIQICDMKIHISRHSGPTDRDPLADIGRRITSEQGSTEASTSSSSMIHPKWICAHCNKSFKVRKNLTQHVNLVHIGRTYKCSGCEKVYKSRQSLSDHVSWIHSQESVSCSRCRKEFATRRHWAIHEATICKVEGSEEKLKSEFNITLLTCPVEGCGKQTDSTRAINFKRHVAFHSSPSYCFKKKVSQPPSLRIQRAARHGEYWKRKRPFSCDLCQPPKTFKEATNLAKHTSTYHPDFERGTLQSDQSPEVGLGLD